MALTSGWDQDPLGSGRAGSMTLVKPTPNLKQVAKAKVVRDDWDDDDDDEGKEQETDVEGQDGSNGNTNPSFRTRNNDGETGTEARKVGELELDSTQIWEEANKRGPMPKLIVAPASTSQGSLPLPSAAFQPTLRILKRPSPNASGNNMGTLSLPSQANYSVGSGSSSGVTSPGPRGTLAEREAQYQEARSRIFGEKLGNSSGNASSVMMSRASSTLGAVVVVREPFGPGLEPEMMEPGDDGQEARGGSGRPAKGFGERRRGRK